MRAIRCLVHRQSWGGERRLARSARKCDKLGAGLFFCSSLFVPHFCRFTKNPTHQPSYRAPLLAFQSTETLLFGAVQAIHILLEFGVRSSQQIPARQSSLRKSSHLFYTDLSEPLPCLLLDPKKALAFTNGKLLVK